LHDGICFAKIFHLFMRILFLFHHQRNNTYGNMVHIPAVRVLQVLTMAAPLPQPNNPLSFCNLTN
jgi:hypothetical protein